MRAFLDIPADSPFSLQNLPFGVFSTADNPTARVGVAVGDWVLDLAVLQRAGLFDGPWLRERLVFAQPALNAFMVLGRPAWREARQRLQDLLRADNPALRDDEALRARALWRREAVTMHLPATIGDYTDFYASREHATTVGALLRGPDSALQPNWLHLPVAYHSRASSVVVSGTDIRRPWGQIHPEGAPGPIMEPTRQLDFELEMAYFVGPGNPLGAPIPIEQAAEHIFGLVLMNDWSARDIQRWEYRPLGPFLGKSFATSISPWVVTLEALEPFRVPGPHQEPEPLPYLRRREHRAYDVHLEVHLQSDRMERPQIIARSNHRYLYWDICQQLAHHTSNGCNLRPGDLLGSGTISGPTPEAGGSLLEVTRLGERPIRLEGGDARRFLADGDRVTMTGWCQGDGYRVGFGEVTARILPARAG